MDQPIRLYPPTSIGAVPESSTWVMMILGFVGLGFMGYRKRDTIASA
jgi:hypothetical protein